MEPTAGPPPHITTPMVLLLIQKNKLGKSAGPSGNVAEMVKSSPDQCSQLIADLVNIIVKKSNPQRVE